MKVCEIFTSVQGEGLDIGLVTTFVRLTGCNLRCRFCDTKYAWTESKVMTVAEVAEIVHRSGARNVCITGGEPLMQADEVEQLVNILRKTRRVTIETNGTIWVDWDVDRWAISPKLSNSGQLHLARPDLVGRYVTEKQDAYLKFVVSTKKDIDEALSFCDRAGVRANVPLVFQPDNSKFDMKEEGWQLEYLKTLRALTEYVQTIRRPNVYVLPQLHVLLYGRKRRK